MRFDDRVAVITGAGGNPSLGRSYALYLASRGAKVVVNDLGVGPDGRNELPANAEAVVQEIKDLGGEAIADGSSVAESDSAKAVVQTALDEWGRIDILVNNAGIAIIAAFDEISDSDVEKSVAVHMLGTIWMCKAAWPHMTDAGYGRIINISSGGILGGSYLNVYGACKAGIFGLSRSLAVEGDPRGIVVNAFAPSATTAAIRHNTGGQGDAQLDWERHTPDIVAPALAYMAHEECTFTGKCVRALDGRVSEFFYSETKGYTNTELEIEDVRDHLDEWLDRSGSTDIVDPVEMEAARGKTFVPKPYVPA
jgi:NAD(P)-dependent dehydrogenase (short-subunit alcohol dehydrogenase family)